MRRMIEEDTKAIVQRYAADLCGGGYRKKMRNLRKGGGF